MLSQSMRITVYGLLLRTSVWLLRILVSHSAHWSTILIVFLLLVWIVPGGVETGLRRSEQIEKVRDLRRDREVESTAAGNNIRPGGLFRRSEIITSAEA